MEGTNEVELVAQNDIQKITIEEYSEIVETSKIEQAIDIRSALIMRVSHPELGSLVVFNTAHGDCAKLAV